VRDITEPQSLDMHVVVLAVNWQHKRCYYLRIKFMGEGRGNNTDWNLRFDCLITTDFFSVITGTWHTYAWPEG